jgi:hypothetical protein
MLRPTLHSLFAEPPVLLPVPIRESTVVAGGERLVWHKATREYGCWTSYGYLAAGGPYLERTTSRDRFVVDVLLEAEYYRRVRGEAARSPVAVPITELWKTVPAPNDGYDPTDQGGPVATRSGWVAGIQVAAFDPTAPPIRRLHLAMSVSGICGARAWLMPINGGPAEPGFRVASEPVAYELSEEYEALGLDRTDVQVSASVALVPDAAWWAAHDHGRPVHPHHVVRAAYLAVLVEDV